MAIPFLAGFYTFRWRRLVFTFRYCIEAPLLLLCELFWYSHADQRLLYWFPFDVFKGTEGPVYQDTALQKRQPTSQSRRWGIGFCSFRRGWLPPRLISIVSSKMKMRLYVLLIQLALITPVVGCTSTLYFGSPHSIERIHLISSEPDQYSLYVDAPGGSHYKIPRRWQTGDRIS